MDIKSAILVWGGGLAASSAAIKLAVDFLRNGRICKPVVPFSSPELKASRLNVLRSLQGIGVCSDKQPRHE